MVASYQIPSKFVCSVVSLSICDQRNGDLLSKYVMAPVDNYQNFQVSTGEGFITANIYNQRVVFDTELFQVATLQENPILSGEKLKSFTQTPIYNKYHVARRSTICLMYCRLLMQMSRASLFARDMVLEVLKHLIPCANLKIANKVARFIYTYVNDGLCLERDLFIENILLRLIKILTNFLTYVHRCTYASSS